ncbi:MAG: tandem-95 repeat protein, partial [Gammaproteobacteria bacterium]|nr:tandem-95 repeat protein [Gammaproteobacteria bacterium]MYB38076.1 tandem-95 repeat protein [Gammaproteobacteria bacterium]
GSAEVSVTVVPVNDAPAAAADEARTLEDTPVSVDVLANDADADGDALSVESVSGAAHGTVRIAADGTVEYAPARDWHGRDRFGYVVSDGAGLTGSAEVSVTVVPVNDAPAAVGTIADQVLDEGGDAVEMDLTPFFADVDGDSLAYRAVSSDTDVVEVSVTGSLLTLSPVVYGAAVVTVTAADPGGLTALQSFAIGVDDWPVRAAVNDTLAAMVRSHLSSARMTFGRRVQEAGRSESGLTIMGRRLPLGRKAVGRMLAACAPDAVPASAGWRGGLGHRWPADGTRRGLAGCPGFGSGAEFSLSMGGGEGNGREWTAWGMRDLQRFDGAARERGHDIGYEGDVRTGYAGLDVQLTDRWLAGLAVSRSGGSGTWDVGGSSGWLGTSLTAVHPYARWSDGTASVWATVGGGRGRAENVREANGLRGASEVGLRLGLVQARRRVLVGIGGLDVELRADAGWAELRSRDGRESIDRQAAAVHQQRLGAEMSRRVLLGTLAVVPYGEAHLRRDGGAGQTGTGLELAGGVRAVLGNARLDVHGRSLVEHSAAGYRERGGGITLSLGGGAEGLSLSASLRSPDGDGVSGRHALVPIGLSPHQRGRASLDVHARYGMRLGAGMLRWSAMLSGLGSDRGSGLAIGIELDRGAGRSATAPGAPPGG